VSPHDGPFEVWFFGHCSVHFRAVPCYSGSMPVGAYPTRLLSRPIRVSSFQSKACSFFLNAALLQIESTRVFSQSSRRFSNAAPGCSSPKLHLSSPTQGISFPAQLPASLFLIRSHPIPSFPGPLGPCLLRLKALRDNSTSMSKLICSPPVPIRAFPAPCSSLLILLFHFHLEPSPSTRPPLTEPV
jgi:hypothetical protein